jgi:hypothetical protein
MRKLCWLLLFASGFSFAQPDALGESIYFWDSAAKRLEYLYIESDGGFSRGPVSIDNEALLFPDTSFVENGKTMVYQQGGAAKPSGEQR